MIRDPTILELMLRFILFFRKFILNSKVGGPGAKKRRLVYRKRIGLVLENLSRRVAGQLIVTLLSLAAVQTRHPGWL